MQEPDETMPLTGHLVELRGRLVWTFLVIAGAALIAFTFGNQLVSILLLPVPDNVEIVQIDVLEGVRVRMKVALLGGFVMAFPVVLYQVVMFVRPALLPHEKRLLYAALPIVGLFFVLGIAFSFLILIPPIMMILPTFLGDLATPQIRVESIVGTTIWLIFSMGLVFEMPVVMFLLAWIGILNPSWVARRRRIAILLAFVAAAVITPTGDPITMTIFGLPIWGLFELGVLFTRFAWWRRHRARRVSAESDDDDQA